MNKMKYIVGDSFLVKSSRAHRRTVFKKALIKNIDENGIIEVFIEGYIHLFFNSKLEGINENPYTWVNPKNEEDIKLYNDYCRCQNINTLCDDLSYKISWISSNLQENLDQVPSTELELNLIKINEYIDKYIDKNNIKIK